MTESEILEVLTSFVAALMFVVMGVLMGRGLERQVDNYEYVKGKPIRKKGWGDDFMDNIFASRKVDP